MLGILYQLPLHSVKPLGQERIKAHIATELSVLPCGSVASLPGWPSTAEGGVAGTGNRFALGSCRVAFPSEAHSPRPILPGTLPGPLLCYRSSWDSALVPGGSARRRAKLVLLADSGAGTLLSSAGTRVSVCPPPCPPLPDMLQVVGCMELTRTRREGLTMPTRPPNHAHRQESASSDGVRNQMGCGLGPSLESEPKCGHHEAPHPP